MKKIYSTNEWKALSKRRLKKELERRRTRPQRILGYKKELREEKIQEKQGRLRQRGKWETIKTPKHFSFINNAQEMIDFLTLLRRTAKEGKNLNIDMSEIESLTSDAITVYLSKIRDDRFLSHMQLRGNEPKDPGLRERWRQSGFYKHVYSTQRIRPDNMGRIQKRKSDKVEPETAKELIFFATNVLYGAPRKLFGVYRTLIECMNNTRNHASKDKDFESWWATVYCDEGAKKACFSFVDNGIGIFRSVRIRGFLRNLASLVYKTHADFMRDILRGQVGSRTGLPYRGKGLPSIYEVLQRGDIDNLIIITNDVYADVAQDRFETLARPFRGTFLYWEIKS